MYGQQRVTQTSAALRAGSQSSLIASVPPSSSTLFPFPLSPTCPLLSLSFCHFISSFSFSHAIHHPSPPLLSNFPLLFPPARYSPPLTLLLLVILPLPSHLSSSSLPSFPLFTIHHLFSPHLPASSPFSFLLISHSYPLLSCDPAPSSLDRDQFVIFGFLAALTRMFALAFYIC